jgi:hypothetical protein
MNCLTKAIKMSENNQELDDAYRFITEHVKRIPGWLEDYAALRTMNLLDWQGQQSIKGALFEIGVFAGRHLSLMLRSAIQQNDRIFGLDTFQWVSQEQVREYLAPIDGRTEFIDGMSTSFTASEILSILGEKPRFISIDGSHECEDVFWDLSIAEQIIAPKGVISADDFLNPLTMGVNEAINKFFMTPRNLSPFAYTSNKLFLCRPAMAATYRSTFEQFVLDDQREPQSAAFRERATHGRHHVEQDLWGRKVLVP